VIVFAMGVLLYETFFADAEDADTPLWLSLLGIAGGVFATLIFWDRGLHAFAGTFALDGIALFGNVLCGCTAALTLLMAPSYLAVIGVRSKEFSPLILFTP